MVSLFVVVDVLIIETQLIMRVDLIYKMVIAVKCVYNKPVFDFLNMIKLI